MAQEPGESSAGEMMVFGLIEQADRMGKAAQGTQRVLTEQIQELAQLQQWTVNAALELQKRADATIQKFEAERAQLHGTQANLERNAMQAIHDAVRKQSGDIERQTVQAFAEPLREIKQAAGYVRKNIKEVKWLTISLIFFAGLAMGLLIAYWPLHQSQDHMQDQMNRIEQSLAAQQQAAPTPAAPDSHKPAPKGKPK
jgi:hypothetical protein